MRPEACRRARSRGCSRGRSGTPVLRAGAARTPTLRRRAARGPQGERATSRRRQGHGHGRALALAALELDRTAVLVDEGARDRETEPGAGNGELVGGARAIE